MNGVFISRFRSMMHCFLEESSSSSSCSFVHIFRSHCVSHLHACFSFQYRLNFASRRTVYVVVGGSLDSRKDSVCNLSNNLIKVQSISLMKLSPPKHAFDVALSVTCPTENHSTTKLRQYSEYMNEHCRHFYCQASSF